MVLNIFDIDKSYMSERGPSIIKIGYLPILLIRNIYIAIFLVLFNSVPVVSITGLLYSSIITLYIEIYYRPYKDKIITIKNIVIEIFLSKILLCGYRINLFSNNLY